MGYKLETYWKEIGKEIHDELTSLAKKVEELEKRVRTLESK